MDQLKGSVPSGHVAAGGEIAEGLRRGGEIEAYAVDGYSHELNTRAGFVLTDDMKCDDLETLRRKSG